MKTETRIKKLQNALKEKDIDFALFYRMSEERNANMLYFSGYDGHGFFVVPKNKRPFFVVPRTELGLAKGTGFKLLKIKKEGAFQTIRKVMRGVKQIGIDEKHFSIYAYRQLRKSFAARIRGIANLCSKIREIKGIDEIRNYMRAAKITDFVFKKCIKNFKKFKKENDVSEFLKTEIAKLGCEPSFNHIVASGKNSSAVHYKPKGKLRNGFCIIDFGIRYKNVCTDITRTIYIGKPSKREKEIYNIVLNSQLNSIKALNEKKRFSEIYDIAIKSLGKYKKNFIHGLGHGIGVEIHESPNIKKDSKDKIKEGMIFTIEPGVYFKNKFGIRIEDDILMAKKGAVILTKSPKNLITINKTH